MMTVIEAERARSVMSQRSDRRAYGQSGEYALIAGVLLAAIIAVAIAAFQYYAVI